MARMRPDLTPEDFKYPASPAEATFYQTCKEKLNDDFLVRYSLPYHILSGGKNRDGEADFVIFHPDGIFIVIEVKGGGVEYDPVKNEWHTITAKGKKRNMHDPFEQARMAKKAILNNIQKSSQWQVPENTQIMNCEAVFFADLTNEKLTQLSSPQRPRKLMGGSQDLEQLTSWLEGIIKNSYENLEISEKINNYSQMMEDIFANSVEVHPLVSVQIEQEEEIRITLTEQQSQILSTLSMKNKAAISGGAGTGKTVIAMQKARILANEAQRTLLLCYNRALADHFKNEIDDDNLLLAMNFHQLCEWFNRIGQKQNIELIEEAKSAYPGHGYFEVQLPYALALGTELLPDERFDAIIVDEAQDFAEEFWLPIKLLLRNSESTLYVFFDNNQALYQNAASFPIKDAPYTLLKNCRNTKFIHEATYRYYEGLHTEPPDIDGVKIETLIEADDKKQSELIFNRISQLLTIEKIKPAEIVVIVENRNKDSYYSLLKEFTLPNNVQWMIERHRVPRTVLIDTFARFKGLEASIVFFWGIDELDEKLNKDSLYTGFSRAKSRLMVVGTDVSVKNVLNPSP